MRPWLSLMMSQPRMSTYWLLPSLQWTTPRVSRNPQITVGVGVAWAAVAPSVANRGTAMTVEAIIVVSVRRIVRVDGMTRLSFFVCAHVFGVSTVLWFPKGCRLFCGEESMTTNSGPRLVSTLRRLGRRGVSRDRNVLAGVPTSPAFDFSAGTAIPARFRISDHVHFGYTLDPI